MKFLVVVCLVALVAADEEKTQEKKTQTSETTQNTLTQPTGSLLNSQVFPPFTSPVSNLAYTGFNGNISPIQGVNPDFFTTGTPTVVNAPIPSFPVTRAVIPGASPVVSAIQSAFPVAGGVFPALVNGVSSQFPGIGSGIISSVTGVPVGATLDANNAANNQAINAVPAAAYRFLTPEGFTGIQGQGIQTAQGVGIGGIPTFSGIIPGTLQGQGIPSGILKNPTGTTNTGISNIPALSTANISSGPLANVFRHA